MTHCNRSLTSDKNRRCCCATFIPLKLSWATTINKFQGFEAGPTDNDPIKYVIADIGSKDDELNRPGLGYVASSRGKSMKLDANSSIESSSVFLWDQILVYNVLLLQNSNQMVIYA